MNRYIEPISQVDVEQRILTLMSELEEETEAFETLSIDAAKKESGYKGAWAREYLSAKGTIKEKEGWADYKLADEHYNWKIAEALVKSKREKLLTLRAALDAMRTLNANVRTQAGL